MSTGGPLEHLLVLIEGIVENAHRFALLYTLIRYLGAQVDILPVIGGALWLILGCIIIIKQQQLWLDIPIVRFEDGRKGYNHIGWQVADNA